MGTSTDHLEGFEELLDVAGLLFLFGSDQFRGLVKTLEPATEEYDLTPTDDDTVLLTAFRSEIPPAAIKVWVSFTDPDGFAYRVTRIRRSPNHLVVRLVCIVLNP
jgi:hypothetical protein